LPFVSYLLSRIAHALATLLGVSLLIFIALRLLPGGFAEILLGPFTSSDARKFVVEQYGLERSEFTQYFAWLYALIHGDFGTSLVSRSSIGAELLRRAPVTIELAVLSTTISLLIGLPLGVLSGIRETGRGIRLLGRLVGALGTGTPEFVLGCALLYLLSGWSLGFSERGFVSLFDSPAENLSAMIVPAASLSMFGIALIVRTTRDAVQRVLTEGHIVTAVARGDGPADIVMHHVLRNTAIPVLTVSATFLGYLLGGAVIVEVLFSIPGVGLYVYNALNNRDYGVVQAGVMISAAVFICINTLVDILYAFIDPRITRTVALEWPGRKR
jgi:peptide/nickel transport system permease protein